jgi:hypothetical protein
MKDNEASGIMGRHFHAAKIGFDERACRSDQFRLQELIFLRGVRRNAVSLDTPAGYMPSA